MAKYLFPAIIEHAEDGYNVSFPDLEDCFTCGSTFEEAIEMANDVLPLMLSEMEDDGKRIPNPSKINPINLSPSEIVSYVIADTDAYRKKYNNKSVKKTLSIPEWLNEEATKAGINFSKTLQDALKEKLEA